MATLRTEEEKSAIVAHCLELERTGGDILGYLWSENYITPRATWCNFQREWLGRKPYQYTDGKPKKKKERKDMSRLIFTNEQKAEAVRIAIEGKSPLPYLESLGAKNPGGAWYNIKSQYARVHPEIAAKIPKHRQGWKAPKEPLQLEAGKNYEVSVADAMAGMKDAADTFFGKCEEMGLKTEEPKITKPVNYDGFEMTAMRSTSTGIFYEYSDKTGFFFVKVGEDTLDLHIDDWKKLLEEIPRAAACLGVEL